MLVLSRKNGQRFIIGDEIVITIVDLDRKTVRVAIDAPKEIPIVREELILGRDNNPPEPRPVTTQPERLPIRRGLRRPVAAASSKTVAGR